MPGHLFEGNPVDEGTNRRITDTPMHRLEKPNPGTKLVSPALQVDSLSLSHQGSPQYIHDSMARINKLELP